MSYYHKNHQLSDKSINGFRHQDHPVPSIGSQGPRNPDSEVLSSLSHVDSPALGCYPWTDRSNIAIQPFSKPQSPRPEDQTLRSPYKGYQGQGLPPKRNFLYPWAPLVDEHGSDIATLSPTSYHNLTLRNATTLSNGNPRALRAIMALQRVRENPPPLPPVNISGFTGFEQKERIFGTNTAPIHESEIENPEIDPRQFVVGLRDCRPLEMIHEGWRRDESAKHRRITTSLPPVEMIEQQNENITEGEQAEESEESIDDRILRAKQHVEELMKQKKQQRSKGKAREFS